MILSFLRRRRREQLRATPFPAAWTTILTRRAPWAARLAPPMRTRLEWLIQVFLAEVHLEGCGGLELDDEKRVTVAANASRLLLGLPEDGYEDLRVVRIYATAYVVPMRRREGALVHEGTEVRLGESWQRGVVVLAWDAVTRGLRDPGDGHDVVLHEFAHQLDTMDGASNGAPVLPDAAAYRAWAEALGASYTTLQADLAAGREGLMDAYGATNPAEFFAVATEAFFEAPDRLARRDPSLYAALRAFYRQDPTVP